MTHFQTWPKVHHITKTYLYNFDPLKPHFYIVKLGFTGVYVIFLISAQNIDCGYSLEPPHRGGSNEYPQSMFWAEIRKKVRFFIWKVSFFDGKIFSIFEWVCFRNGSKARSRIYATSNVYTLFSRSDLLTKSMRTFFPLTVENIFSGDEKKEKNSLDKVAVYLSPLKLVNIYMQMYCMYFNTLSYGKATGTQS